MLVSEYLRQNPAASPGAFYNDVPGLISRALQSGSFPPPAPPPAAANAVTGAPAGILNGFRLELSGLSKGYDRALFIPQADAVFLSLEPKPDEKPLFAALKPYENRFSLQYLYLLDSFTPESLNRLYAFANPAANERDNGGPLPAGLLDKRNILAEGALYRIASYDTGLAAKNARSRAAGNYRRNTSAGTPYYSVTRNLYKTFVSNIAPPLKSAFDFLRRYRSQQLTALNVPGPGEAGGAAKSFERLAGAGMKEAVQTVFFAFSFASRLCSADPSPPKAGITAAQGRIKNTVEDFIRS
jgi:hypothetical protein